MSWKEVYKKAVENGGYPQKRKRDDLKFRDVWLADGGMFYGDLSGDIINLLFNYLTGYNLKAYPEFCTPIIEVRKGFAEEMKDAIIAHRARAVEAAGDDGKVNISNMHYNFSTAPYFWLWNELPHTLGPAYALLMFSDKCRFRMWANRYNSLSKRLEIQAPALMEPDNIEAAYAFLAGTLQGVNGLGLHSKKMKIDDEIKNSSGSGHGSAMKFKCGTDYELPILKDGPDAILRTYNGEITAQEYFSEYLDFYREYIERVATNKEMNILDEFANGQRSFEIEQKPTHTIDADYIERITGKTPEKTIEDFKPTGSAAVFADSITNPVKYAGNTRIRTKSIEWDKIVYEIHNKETSNTRTHSLPFEYLSNFIQNGVVLQEKLVDYLT